MNNAKPLKDLEFAVGGKHVVDSDYSLVLQVLLNGIAVQRLHAEHEEDEAKDGQLVRRVALSAQV